MAAARKPAPDAADSDDAPAAPWGRLVPVEADHARLDMFDAEYSIGRSKRCSLRLADMRISGEHCIIRREEGGTVIITDRSTNGTFVNKERLVANVPRQLHNGDTITLAQPEPSPEDLKDVGAFIFYEFEKRPREASKPTSRVDIGTIYDLRRELGKGTFGVVYLARHRVTGEQCAIKMIRKRKLQQSAYTMEEVEAESRLMVNLKHPYLARLQSSWHDRDHIYLVMDLYTGGELFARIVEGKGVYPEPQAKLITLRLLLALQYLHEHNIAHRDLKPENVMIASTDDDTDVRIVDFGGAKQLRGSGYRSYVGSHQYMAPEVVGRKGSVLKRGRYDQGCDMWSLGIIVYVIISAYTPFTGDAVASSGGRIAWGFNPPAAWKDVSPQCKDLIRHLLDPDQEERLSADEALMHPWLADLYRQWSVDHPQHASRHARTTFDIAMPSSSSSAAAAAAASAAAAGAATAVPLSASGPAARSKRPRSDSDSPVAAAAAAADAGGAADPAGAAAAEGSASEQAPRSKRPTPGASE